MLQTNITFNKEACRLLLHNLVNIDNYGKTYPAIQLFATNESARVFAIVEEIWDRAIFHDCPGPAILVRDFATGLAVSITRSAVKKKEAALKALEVEAQKGKGRALDNVGIDSGFDNFGNQNSQDNIITTCPGLQLYKPDSQTIIIDCILDIEDSIQLPDGLQMTLQRCEWHAVEAIRRKLIKRGYAKKSREEALDLIWKWVKAQDDDLNDTRDALLNNLRPAEREYLNSYYKLKEKSFCRAYTTKLPNLGVHSTQRNEKQHHVITGGTKLIKNISTSQAIEIITKDLKRLPKKYDDMVNLSRLLDPRLIDKFFFQHCMRRLTHYCLELAMAEYRKAKSHLDHLERLHQLHEFDPEINY